MGHNAFQNSIECEDGEHIANFRVSQIEYLRHL